MEKSNVSSMRQLRVVYGGSFGMKMRLEVAKIDWGMLSRARREAFASPSGIQWQFDSVGGDLRGGHAQAMERCEEAF